MVVGMDRGASELCGSRGDDLIDVHVGRCAAPTEQQGGGELGSVCAAGDFNACRRDCLGARTVERPELTVGARGGQFHQRVVADEVRHVAERAPWPREVRESQRGLLPVQDARRGAGGLCRDQVIQPFL